MKEVWAQIADVAAEANASMLQGSGVDSSISWTCDV